LSKSELDELNEKIKNDPQLREMVITFKKLKGFYENLNDKYNKLTKEHDKLKKTKSSLEKKHNKTVVEVQKAQEKVEKVEKVLEKTEKALKVAEKTSKAQEKNSVKTSEKAEKAEQKAKESFLEKLKRLNGVRKRKIEVFQNRTEQVKSVLRASNPFYLLGAYPEVTLDYFNSYPDGRPFYERKNYGLHNDEDYCELADLYNLAHPENMFRLRNFFTDYAKNGNFSFIMTIFAYIFLRSSKNKSHEKDWL